MTNITKDRIMRVPLLARSDELLVDSSFPDKRGVAEPYDPSKIIFEDLVFTLTKNDGKYLRPHVRYSDGKLRVVGNIPFYKATRAAGLQNVAIDLLFVNESEFSEALENFDLKKMGKPRRDLDKFLFFQNYARDCPPDELKDYPLIWAHRWPAQGCLQIRFNGQCSDYHIRQRGRAFLEEYAFPRKLRSVDGLKKNRGYKPFIA